MEASTTKGGNLFLMPLNGQQPFLLVVQVFVEYIQPKDPDNGQLYQKTLLGTVLSISCLLQTPGVVENHGYFLNPSRSSPQEIKVQESNIHQVGRCAGVMQLPVMAWVVGPGGGRAEEGEPKPPALL